MPFQPGPISHGANYVGQWDEEIKELGGAVYVCRRCGCGVPAGSLTVHDEFHARLET